MSEDRHGQRALGQAGVLKRNEVTALCGALDRLGRDLKRDPSPIGESDAEDVHSFVEEQLTDMVGPLAGKLHTGRSRNDQVATDLKLYLKQATAELGETVTDLIGALLDLAERTADLPIPGYTHLQRAQPITAGHHALAYVEMLGRDRTRLRDALVRADTCPLGSAALAGTSFAVDRRALALDLGFAGPTRNSLDAVADRDHACEVVFACAMLMTHLSRLAEDWIFFASHEAGYLRMSDKVATGSSLMPQKKNPDAMELVRGKTGRVTGHLQALLTTLKGLPLAYDKDLQEDKEALFDALDTAFGCVRVTAMTVRTVEYDADRCRSASQSGYQNATDLADLLVRKGVPFRDAHERVGIAVRQAIGLGVELDALPRAIQGQLFPELEGALGRELTVDRGLRRRKVIGGTAPSRVRAEIRSWRRRIKPWDR